MVCGRRSRVIMTAAQAEALNANAPVQDVFPDAPRAEREVIISGTHPSCWAEMFGPAPADDQARRVSPSSRLVPPQGRGEGLRPSRSPAAGGDGAPQARSGRRPQAGDGNRVVFIRSWRSIMAATPCAQVLSRHILASLAALGRSGIPRSLALRAQPAAIAPLSGTKEKDDRGRRPTC